MVKTLKAFQWCTLCSHPVLELHSANCNIMYIKTIVGNLTVIKSRAAWNQGFLYQYIELLIG